MMIMGGFYFLDICGIGKSGSIFFGIGFGNFFTCNLVLELELGDMDLIMSKMVNPITSYNISRSISGTFLIFSHTIINDRYY